MLSEPGGTRIAGNYVVVAGDESILEGFERVPPFTRADGDGYVAELREQGALDPVERAYGTS